MMQDGNDIHTITYDTWQMCLETADYRFILNFSLCSTCRCFSPCVKMWANWVQSFSHYSEVA